MISEGIDKEYAEKILFDLIRLPSFSEKQFGPITERISSELSKIGFSVEYDRESACIIGRKKILGASKTILLSAHYDTVIPVEGWTKDPLSPRAIDGKVYGLGASDCKGGIASILAAAKVSKPKNNITILISGHEDVKKEIDGKLRSGIDIYLQNHKLKANFGIVTEATAKEGAIGILTGHFGKVAVKISAKGVAAHGAHPEQGVNAIEKLIEAYLNIKKELQLEIFTFNGKEYRDTFNLGIIRGGEAINITPSNCTAEFEHRFHPKKNLEDVKERIKQICNRSRVNTNILFEFPPFIAECPNNFKEACARIIGYLPETRITRGGTDANFLNAHGIQTIVIGPGETKTIHAPNEYVEIDRIIECAKILSHTIQRGI